MDEERKIRFVLPPLFLIGSIGWAVFSDSDTTLNQVIQSTFGLEIDDLGGMLALLAGGGVAVVTFGFLLGTLTIFVLRTTFRIGWNKYHEVFVSNDALDKIWHTIGVTDKQHQTVENELFAVATFDHETIKGRTKPMVFIPGCYEDGTLSISRQRQQLHLSSRVSLCGVPKLHTLGLGFCQFSSSFHYLFGQPLSLTVTRWG